MIEKEIHERFIKIKNYYLKIEDYQKNNNEAAKIASYEHKLLPTIFHDFPGFK